MEVLVVDIAAGAGLDTVRLERELGRRVVHHVDARVALIRAFVVTPDLIVIRDRGEATAALDFIERFRDGDCGWSAPIILMVGEHEPGLTLAALETGATEVLGEPLDARELTLRARNLLRLRDPAPVTVPDLSETASA